jgi:hypothetical protein
MPWGKTPRWGNLPHIKERATVNSGSFLPLARELHFKIRDPEDKLSGAHS